MVGTDRTTRRNTLDIMSAGRSHFTIVRFLGQVCLRSEYQKDRLRLRHFHLGDISILPRRRVHFHVIRHTSHARQSRIVVVSLGRASSCKPQFNRLSHCCHRRIQYSGFSASNPGTYSWDASDCWHQDRVRPNFQWRGCVDHEIFVVCRASETGVDQAQRLLNWSRQGVLQNRQVQVCSPLIGTFRWTPA